MKIFGTSGIRLKADRSLLELAFKCGLFVGGRHRRVVIASDSRTSSPAIKSALIAGLSGSGANSLDIGMMPTPVLAYTTREFDVGVMTTASHNPPEYNGLKFFNPDGSAYSEKQKTELETRIYNDNVDTVSWEDFGTCQYMPGLVEGYMNAILSCFPEKLNLKVVVDCGGGAASEIAPLLLRRLGCEVVELFCKPEGCFPRPSEPVEENLGRLKQAVISNNADLGLAHDGDADRLMAIDDQGKFVNGDLLMVILATAISAKKVVTTVDASSVIDEQGFTVKRTPVGDNYVSQVLAEWGDFGGEPSGSWVFPSFSYCPDGLFAAAQLVATATRSKISTLVNDIPQYPIRRLSVMLDHDLLPAIIKQLMILAPDTIDNTDGFKMVYKDCWVLIRPSGTEPKIRFTLEAHEQQRLEKLSRQVIDCVNLVAGKEIVFE
jgi:phosphoglucosamine mutase